MKLTNVHVTKFRNIDDSDPIEVSTDVTCVVGKNESGKTAVLEAMAMLNPAQGGRAPDALKHYPRWLYTKDRKAETIDDTALVEATFACDADDVAELEARFGIGVVSKAAALTASRYYDGELVVELPADVINEHATIKHLAEEAKLSGPSLAAARKTSTMGELRAMAQSLQHDNPPPEGGEPTSAAAEGARLVETISGAIGGGTLHEAVESALEARLPKFFYFGEYSMLSGRVDLQQLAEGADLDPGAQTARALLRLAGADDAMLADEDYEKRKAELEAVANDLTRELSEYWSQGQDLDVVIDVDKITQNIAQGQRAVARFLEIRVKDRRHGHTDNFEKRSNGFRWFFSFLAAFSEFERTGSPVVILLDEPAMALHARAQADFLRFINERLATKHQVIYTTHSPFMVEPGRLDRVRLVEDKGKGVGAKVSQDVLSTDADTLFPLQAALGYDIAQNLFVGPHNLLLEGTSDLVYVTAVSEHLKALERTHLDERWVPLPAAGVTKVSTFLALLGHHLDVTVLVDAGSGNKRVRELVKEGHLKAERFITPADVTGTKEADIEDLFTVDEYLTLYNKAFGTQLKKSDLKGSDRVVRRIARALGDYNHGAPADVLLRSRELVERLSDGTLDNFETLFERINATLPTGE